MKPLLLALLFFTVPVLADTPVKTQVEKEFYKFFKHELRSVKMQKQVSDKPPSIKINVAPIQEAYVFIELNIELNVTSAEKVLLLREDDKCTNNSTFIAGFTLNPKKNINIIHLRMDDHCRKSRLTAFVKTENNEYYFHDSAVIRMVNPWDLYQ